MSSDLSVFVESVSYSGPLGGAPTVLEAAGLWVAVFLAGFVLQEGFRSLLPTTYRRLREIRIPGTIDLWWTRPSRLTERVFPGVPDGFTRSGWEVWRLDDLARGWGAIGIVILDFAAIELLFRGVPFAVATAVGEPPVLPVVLGSLVWVLLQGLDTLPVRLLSAAFFAWAHGCLGSRDRSQDHHGPHHSLLVAV